MVNYACAKKVPDSTKLRLLKGQKTNFPRGACPRTPLVCPCFAHRYGITGNENALNFADSARAIVIQWGSSATVMCYRGTLNIGQTLHSCPTASTKECHNHVMKCGRFSRPPCVFFASLAAAPLTHTQQVHCRLHGVVAASLLHLCFRFCFCTSLLALSSSLSSQFFDNETAS